MCRGRHAEPDVIADRDRQRRSHGRGGAPRCDAVAGDGRPGSARRVLPRRATRPGLRGRHRTARYGVQLRRRDGTRPDRTRRGHPGPQPAGAPSRSTRPSWAALARKAGTRRASAVSFSFSSRRARIPTRPPPGASRRCIEPPETDAPPPSRRSSAQVPIRASGTTADRPHPTLPTGRPGAAGRAPQRRKPNNGSFSNCSGASTSLGSGDLCTLHAVGGAQQLERAVRVRLIIDRHAEERALA